METTEKFYFKKPESFPFKGIVDCATSVNQVVDGRITENGRLLLLLTPNHIFTKGVKIKSHYLIINSGEDIDGYKNLGQIKVDNQTLTVWLENIS